MTSDTENLVPEVRRLEERGPRLTGSDAHQAQVAHIASQLTDLGLDVKRDLPHKFTRWDVPRDRSHLGLQIEGAEVEVSSAFPYSGTTGPQGVTAPLHLISGIWKNWSRARGAIAVVEVKDISVPFDLLFKPWNKSFQQKPVQRPIISAYVFSLLGEKLDAARKAGVLGVICVWGPDISAGNAKDQYLPFWEDYHDLPAVWVAGEAGKNVITAARQGKNATLLLDATLTPDCEIQTVWAVSPGKVDNETVLIVTHSDGTNAVEENGHIALIELARDAVTHPHERTFVYVFATGHLRIPALSKNGTRHFRMPGVPKKDQATSPWLRAHPELWADGKAAAGLVIEHLGALEVDKNDKPTGDREPEIIYATTRELHDRALKLWFSTKPVADRFLAPRPLIHLGEGETLYQEKIPVIALVTGPRYLLAIRAGGLVDTTLMAHQIESFRRLQAWLDKASRTEIGDVRWPSFWERLVTIARFALVLLNAGHRRP